MSGAVVARAAVAPLAAGPTLRAEQVSQLVLGEGAVVLEREGAWRRVRTALDGYDGWVHAGYCVELDEAALEAWRCEADGWSDGAVVRAGDARVRLPLRARVALEGDGIRLPDGRRGRLADGTVRGVDAVTSAARAEAPEQWAFDRFGGAPYQWGGVTPFGVDCSGLVQTTFLARGTILPRDSSQQAACGRPVDPGGIRAGDVLFFRSEEETRVSHVGFAGGDETLIHSSVACGGVVRESWRPGTRAAPLRELLVAVRRLEER